MVSALLARFWRYLRGNDHTLKQEVRQVVGLTFTRPSHEIPTALTKAKLISSKYKSNSSQIPLLKGLAPSRLTALESKLLTYEPLGNTVETYPNHTRKNTSVKLAKQPPQDLSRPRQSLERGLSGQKSSCIENVLPRCFISCIPQLPSSHPTAPLPVIWPRHHKPRDHVAFGQCDS